MISTATQSDLFEGLDVVMRSGMQGKYSSCNNDKGNHMFDYVT